MKKKNLLFHLIKSLDKGEKVHFRKIASINEGKKNYLKLFNALDRQKEYDEKALKKSLRGEPLLKHLPESKYYLQQLILKSLNSYHSASSVNMELKEILNTIEILHNKALVEYIPNLIKKGKSIAEKHERFLQLLEFLKWERKLLFQRIDPETFEESDKALLEKICRFIEQEYLIYKSNTFRHHLMVFPLKKGKYQEETKLKMIKTIFSSQLKAMRKMEEKTLSFDAKRVLYNTYFLYYKLIQDNKGWYIWSEKIVKLMEANLHLVSETPSVYINALYNHMGCLNVNGRYEECLEVSKTLKAVPSQLKVERTEAIERQMFGAFQIELFAYGSLGHFREAILASKDAEIQMERFKEKISKHMLVPLCYNLAFIYFIRCDFSNAIKWVNKIVNDPQFEGNGEYINIICKAHILNLMIHFEKGNNELLEYLSKSTLRYLHKRGKLYKCEIIFLDSIRKLSIGSTLKEKSQVLKKLKNKIEELKKDPSELEIIEWVYINIWIDSKLKGNTFEEEYLKKLKIKN